MRGQCLPPGDASVFAAVDIAWLYFFTKLALSREAIFESHTAILYDNVYPAQAVQQDFVYPPLEPQFIANGEFFPTTLSRYWQSPADITFLRHDTIGKPGGSLITQVFASGGPAYDWFRNESTVNDLSWPGFLPNVAQIIPPETRAGQFALNGDLHVVDKVLVPNPNAFCRAGDFEFYQGFAFSSLVTTRIDISGQPINDIVPRALAFSFCERLPCTYEIPGLYGRAGFRLSVEATVQYKSVLPLCDPWCSPSSFWWCIPCTGIYAQNVLTIGGCAPFQNEHHCGGALSIWVTDAGEVRFGFQTFIESFSLLPIFIGGGMRTVDLSVPAKGFKVHDGQVFKVLASYDGLCNCTKIYINDKLRGIADPFDIGQYVFQPFANVSDNLFESVTLGHALHSRGGVPTATTYPTAEEVLAATGGTSGTNSSGEEDVLLVADANLYIQKDWSLPAAGQFATYPSDPVLVGRNPTQLFLPWKGNVLSASVWFDNGNRQGIVYPSTCVTPPFGLPPPLRK
ncbi:uncharacterized protein MICPUCDRAFT_54765 [Micromonas pusilla CCMP1545]|uniref:Predicted protein n=1 Tax=Micromonas pusilla (strain CCMP1545) TaxID=564608 RepID=C1NA54_MICPC|nr:uncharacterized protein MICPUCDRAFT_54765 [Micromonas pusilla CCMP1545]EEH51064.1 predicted protein [Micromonas pusilla CCMP1545]|eukprot:XP_003064730.1 predicted protein [Micromonas pusilla CCMP1545]